MATKATPDYDASLADHGFEAKAFKGLTYPLGDHAPAYGEIYPIAPDIGWTRMPVPGNLAHINLWLLDEGEAGYALVDTGLFMPPTIEQWKAMFAGNLADRELKRIFVTHFHPDHVGCAGWLSNKFKVPVWMNRTEWLMARMLIADQADQPPEDVLSNRRFAGFDEERIDAVRKRGWGGFARAVSRLPTGHVRMDDGQVIRVGQRDWTVMTGGGHTPEHACLVDFNNGMIIAGDQILPRITSNVSVMDSEPTADAEPLWVLKAPYQVGTEWTTPTVPYLIQRRNEHPRDLKYTHKAQMTWRIEAVDDTVTTPSGTHSPCLRVVGRAELNLYTDPVNGFSNVPLISREWYCQGVGLVKFEREEKVPPGFLSGGTLRAEAVR